ncbi:extracellular solute-binding protein [Paenibacillus psychroresistens]|uniref:Extracellular solute-binding protein n=1 Tax=Paenibacillus psychroresistens TaxID=1778678 RepID=A0A6B8RU31_9BACL|nr:extracellular solute-binding protein [Paenibacillus psychroresistens]QGQ99437.1 extracellular solute-binding protein [Paenibacillus psychroresistens]
MKRGLCFLMVTLLVLSTVGCKGDGFSKNKAATTLKVLYYDEATFYSKYGSLFMAQNPEINVEVVSTAAIRPLEMDKFIEEQAPDVLMLNSNQYEKYADDGMLYDLESLIRKDKFNLEGIAPTVIDTIKAMSGGRLYGLSPFFSSQAIYYNIDLFDRIGVTYPKDQMNWEEVLQLAQRFPTTDGDSKIYGLMLNRYDVNPYNAALQIGYAQGLSYYDAENMKMTIHTNAWSKVFQLTIDALKTGAIFQNVGGNGFTPGLSNEEVIKQDPFFSGKIAMIISTNDYRSELKRAETNLGEQMPEWDLVTVPIDLSNPDTGNAIWIEDIATIRAQSSNLQAAWSFVSYINSDEFARVASKASINGSMPTRTAYIKDEKGHHLEAFYALKPYPNTIQGSDKIPQNFYQTFETIARQEITAVYEGRKTIDEALFILQQRGQALF